VEDEVGRVVVQRGGDLRQHVDPLVEEDPHRGDRAVGPAAVAARQHGGAGDRLRARAGHERREVLGDRVRHAVAAAGELAHEAERGVDVAGRRGAHDGDVTGHGFLSWSGLGRSRRAARTGRRDRCAWSLEEGVQQHG
jgi:hypothetical protein